jgi:Mg2+ and Co2+ transporter CorA|tara:strand:+ start:521 stop:814 length:294 start_codon:yes stop_codon:yes gene_type:complete
MAKELNEDYGFKISIKTLVGIAIAITTVVSFWFAQQAQINELRTEIEEAKELPRPNISRTEYELKDELVRQTILDTQDDVDDIKESLDRIEDKLYNR